MSMILFNILFSDQFFWFSCTASTVLCFSIDKVLLPIELNNDRTRFFFPLIFLQDVENLILMHFVCYPPDDYGMGRLAEQNPVLPTLPPRRDVPRGLPASVLSSGIMSK